MWKNICGVWKDSLIFSHSIFPQTFVEYRLKYKCVRIYMDCGRINKLIKTSMCRAAIVAKNIYQKKSI